MNRGRNPDFTIKLFRLYMDLVWLRELVCSLDFRRVTRVLRIFGLEGNNSRFGGWGALEEF